MGSLLQANAPLIIVLGGAAFIAGVLALIRKMRFKPQCPRCHSHELVELNRETLASRTVERFGSGTPAGGDVRLQLDLELTYRCRHCGQKFSQKFSETQ